jgi:hypothetical protein
VKPDGNHDSDMIGWVNTFFFGRTSMINNVNKISRLCSDSAINMFLNAAKLSGYTYQLTQQLLQHKSTQYVCLDPPAPDKHIPLCRKKQPKESEIVGS